MRIKTIRIHHYRSIKYLTIECGSMTVFLGPNNHGKSNILGALEFFFSSSSKPSERDFFRHRADDAELWVDLTFDGLSDQEKRTFKKYVDSSGCLRLRKIATLDSPDENVAIGYRGWLLQPTVDWLIEANAGGYTVRANVPEELETLVPGSGRLSKSMIIDAQNEYINQNRSNLEFEYLLEEGPLLGQKNVAAGVLPDVYLIPAVRDLSQDTAVKSTTTFGRLLNRAILEMTEADEDFKRLRNELTTLIDRLNRQDEKDQRPEQLTALESAIVAELSGWDVKLDIEVQAPDIEKVFELGTTLHVDDGVRTRAEDKGHGLQRAMIFALTRVWAKALRSQEGDQEDKETTPRGRSESMILLIEEPELFLHPHAQRHLQSSLKDISSNVHHQVLLCTHSSQFVDMGSYKHLAMIYRPAVAEGTQVRQCRMDLFEGEDERSRKQRFKLAHWINPERGELFFARRAIFVEGATEQVVLPFLAQKLGVYDPDVSVIDAGSKHNLPLYMELAGAFNLEHLVIHDEDPVAGGLEGDRLTQARRTFELNITINSLSQRTGSKIEMLSPDFEGCAGVSKRRGDKKGKPLAALDHFEALDIEEIPLRVRQIVETAYSRQA